MAEPTRLPDIAALARHEGEVLGHSDWVEVGQARIDAFADATGDRQWIHVDAERAAKESPFGGPIAHGYLTLSLVPALLPQVVEVAGASRVINYGIEKLRLPAPVPAGARVRLHAAVKGVRPLRGGGARVTLGIEVEVEGQRRRALTGEVVYVYFP